MLLSPEVRSLRSTLIGRPCGQSLNHTNRVNTEGDGNGVATTYSVEWQKSLLAFVPKSALFTLKHKVRPSSRNSHLMCKYLGEAQKLGDCGPKLLCHTLSIRKLDKYNLLDSSLMPGLTRKRWKCRGSHNFNLAVGLCADRISRMG